MIRYSFRSVVFLFLIIGAGLYSCAPAKKTHKKPVDHTVKKTTPAISTVYHKVERGETLESIATKFKITVQNLKSLNPGVTKANQGDLLRVPVMEKEIVKEPVKEVKPKYNIALLLPFNASKAPDTSQIDNSSDKAQFRSVVAAEYYEGALMAIDSLGKKGLSAKFQVYDTENDSSKLKKILQKETFKESSVIVGPFDNSHLGVVSRYSKLTNIPFISPVSVTAPSFLDNPNALIFTPTVNTQCRLMAEYILANYKGINIVILRQSTKRDAELAAVFKSVLKGVKEMDKGNYKEVVSYLAPGKNVIIAPSSDEAFVTEMLLFLKGKTSKYNLTLVGLPTWENFETLDVDLLQDLNALIFKSVHIDADDANVKEFRKKFQALYKGEPSAYSFQGFSEIYYLGTLLNDGKKLTDETGFAKSDGLYGSFDFKRYVPGGAIENQSVNILKYQDYQLQKVNK